MTESKALSKNLVCIVMRGGFEIWLEQERANVLQNLLQNPASDGRKFISLDGELLNVADVVGIFSAKTMEEKTMVKNGYWKCKRGNYWHKRFEQCAHGRH